MKICQRLFVFTDVRVYRIACDCHHPGESHTRICLYRRRLEDDKSEKADDMFLEYISAKNGKSARIYCLEMSSEYKTDAFAFAKASVFEPEF